MSPRGSCGASVGWAKLLYALDLHPNSKALHWKSTQRTKFDPTAPGAIRLEVDGPVLCHIINLYRIYDQHSNRSTTASGPPKVPFELSSGRLEIQQAGDSSAPLLLEFKEGSQEELGKTRVPFHYTESQFRRWTVKIYEGTAYTSYQLALRYGISNTRAALSVEGDHYEKSRKERGKRLISSMNIVLGSSQELLLVTERWIDHATRIRRRVTADPRSEGLLVEQRTSPVRGFQNPGYNYEAPARA